MFEQLHPAYSVRRQQQKGYVLLALLLVVAVLMIGMAVAVQSLAFQIKRDREEEMVHRGVQYSRAIRRYAKQTGMFPARLEDLRDLGGQRFIRKLYKDPITKKDFQVVYEADIRNPQILANRNLASAQQNSGGTDSNAANPQAVEGAQQDPANATASSQQAGDSSANSDPASPAIPDRLLPRVGSIFGVVSASKDQTIREFNRKNHYNEWMFFYHPNYDRGLEIRGPTPLTPASFGGPAQPPAQAPSTP